MGRHSGSRSVELPPIIDEFTVRNDPQTGEVGLLSTVISSGEKVKEGSVLIETDGAAYHLAVGAESITVQGLKRSIHEGFVPDDQPPLVINPGTITGIATEAESKRSKVPYYGEFDISVSGGVLAIYPEGDKEMHVIAPVDYFPGAPVK